MKSDSDNPRRAVRLSELTAEREQAPQTRRGGALPVRKSREHTDSFALPKEEARAEAEREEESVPAQEEEKPAVSAARKRAVKSALNILDYADNTERRLREKLTRKGHAPEDIAFAVAYVKKHGILNDRRYAANHAEYLAEAKCYGRARIIQNLYEKGFGRDVIDALDFSGFDFEEGCLRRMQRAVSADSPDELSREEREKLFSSLRRYGFTYSEIRQAEDKWRLEAEEEEARAEEEAEQAEETKKEHKK